MAHEVTLQTFELLPILQTNDVIGLDGPLDRHGGFEFLDHDLRPLCPQERLKCIRDQRRQILSLNGVIGYVGSDNGRRAF